MKVAVDKLNFKIISKLPENATEDHSYLKINNYALMELDDVLLENGLYREIDIRRKKAFGDK